MFRTLAGAATGPVVISAVTAVAGLATAVLTAAGSEITEDSVCEVSGKGFESKTGDWLRAVRDKVGGEDAASVLTVQELPGEQMAR